VESRLSNPEYRQGLEAFLDGHGIGLDEFKAELADAADAILAKGEPLGLHTTLIMAK
jgi:hypothetical protein